MAEIHKGVQGWNNYYTTTKSNVKDYPPYLDYPKERKTQTNADKVRRATDEELVDLWYFIYSNVIFNFTDSRQGLLQWLEQEVRDGDA